MLKFPSWIDTFSIFKSSRSMKICENKKWLFMSIDKIKMHAIFDFLNLWLNIRAFIGQTEANSFSPVINIIIKTDVSKNKWTKNGKQLQEK
jgi:hypothetical protein